MDKTLADCWAYLRRHRPAAWYFADAVLAISDEPGIRPMREIRRPDGVRVLEITADSLRELAWFATINEAIDGP